MTEDGGQKMRKRARTVLITGECSRHGRFDVVRKRKPIKTDGCPERDLPQNVVCPTCRCWAEIIKIKDR